MLFRRSSLIGLRLTLLAFLSIALMFFDHKDARLEELHRALSVVIAPLQYAVDWPVEAVAWLKNSISGQQALLADNANLRAENLVLQGEMQRILSLQRENEQLRELLQSSSAVGEHFTVAQLLAVSTERYVAEMVLDKGENQHVYVGQPVLDAHGVMGQVIRVGPLTSRVMLITDARSAVPVQNVRNGLRGIVTGTGDYNDLSLINIADVADVKVGDLLTSSSLGMRYPEGYPVGVVSKVIHHPGESFLQVAVTPSAHLYQSRQVLLVWQKAPPVGMIP